MHMLKYLAAAAMALLLSGCWEADGPLMPASAKVALFPGAKTLYVVSDGAEQRVRLTPGSGGTYLLQNLDEADSKPETVSFALISAPRSQTNMVGDTYQEAYYLIENHAETNTQKRYFAVMRAMIWGPDDVTYGVMSMACGEATLRFADGRGDSNDCRFKTYDALLAATRDAVGWMREARTALRETSYSTKPRESPRLP